MQVSPSSGPTEWQERYREMSEQRRQIVTAGEARPGAPLERNRSSGRQQICVSPPIRQLIHK